jgi:quercetin dioxygenase-like cupin family protein
MQPTPTITRGPGEGRSFDAPAGFVTVKVRADQTRGTLTAMESEVPPGSGPPLHVHRNEDEFIHVLDGRARLRLGEALRDAPAGTFVFVPRGVAHTWQVVGDAPARLLFGFTPGSEGMERFFAGAAGLSALARGSEAFRRFADDAGMDVVGPPLAEAVRAPD